MKPCKTLYVSDMDGTLLNSSSVLSETTTAKLNKLIGEGALFTVATARTPATVVELMKNVDSNLPYIVMAGCATWDNRKKGYESARIISNSSIERLIGIFEKNGNNPFIYYKNGNQIVVNHVKELTAEEKEFIEPRIKTPLKILKTCSSLTVDTTLEGAMLIFSMGKFEALRNIADEIDKEGIDCTYNCYHDIFKKDEGFIDIYVNGTTKAAAIKELTRKIGAERIVVFGDNLNDIPMMKVADWSVAVSNAFDEVKKYANEITESNDEDAVVRWIERDIENNSMQRKK
ncbi:Cof-type HAD-IIB family hydrolase [Prevotella sp.]|uniref:Cof-type HAD-IIB family hydrolase n=1 Tax=Prevotella sp. TaxID=59823 RepID=UPI003FD725FB